MLQPVPRTLPLQLFEYLLAVSSTLVCAQVKAWIHAGLALHGILNNLVFPDAYRDCAAAS